MTLSGLKRQYWYLKLKTKLYRHNFIITSMKLAIFLKNPLEQTLRKIILYFFSQKRSQLSIKYQGQLIWNSLDSEIKNGKCLKSFKFKLKSSFLNKYNWSHSTLNINFFYLVPFPQSPSPFFLFLFLFDKTKNFFFCLTRGL